MNLSKIKPSILFEDANDKGVFQSRRQLGGKLDLSSPIANDVMELLMTTTIPDKETCEEWAMQHGYKPHEVKQIIYCLAGYLARFLKGGKSNLVTKDINPDELSMGIKVELEHTPDAAVAEKIARDHLMEMDDYYTRLKRMEDGEY